MKTIKRMQKENYWIKRKKHNSIVFHLKKAFYSVKERLLDKGNDLITFGDVFKRVIPSILLSCLTIALLFLLDRLFVWTKLLNYSISNKSEALMDLSIAFIGFNGVFLAIYFSSTASIFTSKYANISEKVSKRFFYESTKYSNILVFNVLILSAFVASLGCGVIFTVIVPIAIGLISLATLFSFYKLGSIAFALSDINTLASFSRKEIAKYIKKAGELNLFNSPEFQDFYRRKVKSEIEILTLIASYLAENNNYIYSDKTVDFITANLGLIIFYHTIKHQIPKGSKWYDVKGECPYWFTADDSSKAIAIDTGTSLHYKEVIDEFWFEKAILSLNDLIINSNLEKPFSYSRYLLAFSETISRTISFSNIGFWVDNIEFHWKNYILKYIKTHSNESLSVVTGWTSIIIDTILGTNKKLASFSVDSFNTLIDGLANNPTKIEPDLLKIVKSEELNELINSLKNEVFIEGKVLTPKWYIAEIVSYVLRQSVNNVSVCCDKLYALYLASCEDLNKEEIHNRELLAIASLSNKEIKQKLSSVFSLIIRIDSDLKDYHIDNYFKELDYNYESAFEQKTDIHRDNLKSYEGIIELYKSNYNKRIDSPDYIGFAYNNLIYDAFNSILIKNDANVFISHLKLIMDNASIIECEVKKSISNFTPSDRTIQLEHSVRLSIMDIAGYYFYYNLLINNQENIKALITYFDNYFLNHSNYEKEVGSYIIAYRFNTELHHILSVNSMETINRKLAFQSFIKEQQLLHFKTDAFMERVDHANKYIEAFPYDKEFGFFGDFYEFFGVFYLNRFLKPEAKLKTKDGWEKRIYEQ